MEAIIIIINVITQLILDKQGVSHRQCNDYRARLVWQNVILRSGQVRSNQRLWNLYLLLLRKAHII